MGGFSYRASCGGGVAVSEPTELLLETGFVTGRYAHGVAVKGEYAYLADGAGLKVFRVFEAAVPVQPTTFGGVKAMYSGADGRGDGGCGEGWSE